MCPGGSMISINVTGYSEQQYLNLVSLLTQINGKLDKLIMTDAQVKVILDRIDATTTAIGTNVSTASGNVSTIGTVAVTIKTELEDFIAKAGAGGGLSDANSQQLQALADRLDQVGGAAQKTSDDLAAQVPVLNAIAAEGAPSATPAPPPPVTPAP